MSFSDMFGSSNQSGPTIKPPDMKKIRKYGTLAVIVIVILMIGTTCWYTVNDKEQAVVTTFGKVTSINDAGVHLKIPFGIQKVHKVDINVFHRMELGYRTDTNNPIGYTVVDNESKMITGDYNIVNVDFFIEYKISDPVKFLFSSYSPEDVLKNLAQSQIRNVVGSTNVDSVLTDGKELIQMKVRESIIQTLELYDIGLMITDVKIQDSEPPTAEVIAAFKSVETAKQNADTLVNQAKAYANSQLPAANAKADSLIQNAQYLKQKRINEAIENVAMFEAMYSEYKLNPEITRSRMYYEMITKTMPGVRLYVDLSEGGVQKLLPLENFTGNTYNDNTIDTGSVDNEGSVE